MCYTHHPMSNLLTTKQVTELLSISFEEFKILRHSLNIEGVQYVCKNKNVAYLFSKDQVIALLQGQLLRFQREEMKERSNKLLKNRIKNRQIDKRNSTIKVIPDWK